MSNSLLYWTQKLFEANLLIKGSRILGLTSEGNYVAMEGYGPVSVAKVAMEAIIRQVGWELGQYGITANAVVHSVFSKSPRVEKPTTPRLSIKYNLNLIDLKFPEDLKFIPTWVVPSDIKIG